MRKMVLVSWGLLLASCGPEPASQQPSAQSSQAGPSRSEPGQQNPAGALTSNKGGCPFTNTRGWYAQIERNTFSVDGQVDLMMAGYKPVLKKRPSAGAGTAAFDLSLEPAPGGAVTPAAHYEEPLTQAYGKVAIYCGGQQVASFESMDQRL
jgi:hypothetical protein